MLRFPLRICALALLLLTLGWAATAPGKEALLLYKSSEERDPATSRLAIGVQPTLAKLGYTVRFHDVDSGLPQMEGDKASVVVTWFSTPRIADPQAYIDWLAAQTAAGRKVIVLGNFGAHTADGTSWMTNESLNRFFYPFGLSYEAAYTGDAKVLSVSKESSPAKAPEPLAFYLLFRSVNPANKIYLEVTRSDLPSSASALVVQTPYGAMAQESYIKTTDLEALIRSTLAAPAVASRREKRLLALYKASEGVDPRTNLLARFAAEPLFDLGYALDYQDIEQGLPSAERMAAYDGVLSWYNTPEMPRAADYANWLTDQMEAGRKVVVLGNWGAFAEDIHSKGGTVKRFVQSPEYNRFFYPFGLEFRSAWTPEKSLVKVDERDQAMVPWLEPDHVGHYYWIRSVNPANKVYLSVSRTDLKEGESAVVVTTPAGGLALESYLLSTDPTTKKPRFHIDFKAFLQASLGGGNAVITRPAEGPTATSPVARPRLGEFAAPTMAAAPPFPKDVTPTKRKVLAFYRRDKAEKPEDTQVYYNADTILNYLGLIVEYRAIEDPLPSDAEMADIRGIILWLSYGEIPRAQAFDAWFRAQMKAGVYGVVFGGYDLAEETDLSEVDPTAAYATMGLSYDPLGSSPNLTGRGMSGFRTGSAKHATVAYEKPGVMGFERKIDWKDSDLDSGWPLVRAKSGSGVEVGLTVTRPEGASDVIAITPTGGVALGPFPRYDSTKDRAKLNESLGPLEDGSKVVPEAPGGEPWRLDPFWFLATALRVETLGRPDLTTLNGNRIYFSHIDGDAFGGISLTDRSSLNGEIMQRDVLRDLGLPITVSFVTRDIEKRLDPRYSRELEVARNIVAMSNVEAASHTHTHPFDWQKGDLVLDPASPAKVTLKHNKVDLTDEVTSSVAFVDSLCDTGKRCAILLWSGRCNPPASAIAAVDGEGIPNLNGGESILDTANPNIAGVRPLFAILDGRVQYHVSAAGDFYYTRSWTRDYDGMKRLPDYWQRTDSPRRLRATNVYYHFYLAERQLGIDGLKVAYDYVKANHPAPMFASEYVEVMRDWLQTRSGTTADGANWIGNTGHVRTLRFDATKQYPDFEASKGVLGFNRANGSLYVHLDGSGQARVKLTDKAPTLPYVERFSHFTKSVKIGLDEVVFDATGQGPAELVMKNLRPSTKYLIEVGTQKVSATTDSGGTLLWSGRLDGYRTSTSFLIRKVTP